MLVLRDKLHNRVQVLLFQRWFNNFSMYFCCTHESASGRFFMYLTIKHLRTGIRDHVCWIRCTEHRHDHALYLVSDFAFRCGLLANLRCRLFRRTGSNSVLQSGRFAQQMLGRVRLLSRGSREFPKWISLAVLDKAYAFAMPSSLGGRDKFWSRI